jgi:hypothetical protein
MKSKQLSKQIGEIKCQHCNKSAAHPYKSRQFVLRLKALAFGKKLQLMFMKESACISIQDLHAHPSEGNDLQLRRFKSHQTRLLLLLLLTPPRPAAQEVLVTPKKTIPLPHAGAFDYRTFSQI